MSATASIVVAVLGILAAMGSGLGAAWWKMRGQINTSSADELWEETRSIREFQTQEAKELRRRINICDAANDTLRRENENLRFTIIRLRSQLISAGVLKEDDDDQR